MPGYRTHIGAALILWASVLFFTSMFSSATTGQILEWGFATLVGALFPDLDTKSMGQKWLYRVLFIVGLLLIVSQSYRSAAMMLLISSIPLMMPHRGLLHSGPFISALTVFSIYILIWKYPLLSSIIISDAVFFLIGVFSHLILDRTKLK